MRKETAQGLIDLLAAIDADHPKDFVDSVCTARERLPESVVQELQDVTQIRAIAEAASDYLVGRAYEEFASLNGGLAALEQCLRDAVEVYEGSVDDGNHP